MSLIIMAITALSLAVTSKSLWMDEAFTAWLVAHRTLHSFLSTMASPAFAPVDRLYPLYDIWMLAWTHLFGFSEYALRAANIPFGAVFVLAMAVSSQLIFGRRFAWAPFALAPFAWFYMNEARPYMMLLAFSTATAGALGTAIFGPSKLRAKASWLFLWMLLFTCMTDIVAVLALPSILVLLVVGVRNGSLNARLIERALLLAPLFALVFAYYAVMLATPGARGEVLEDARRSASLALPVSSLYEQVGLAGIGPPRNSVRSSLMWSTVEPYIALLGAALLAYMAALALSLRGRLDAQTAACLSAWAVAFACSAVIASALDVRFLGRHLSAIVPFLLLGTIGLLRSRTAVLLIAVVLCASDLRLSLLPEYGKDDYRATVNDVVNRLRETGGAVYWSADPGAASYYGLALHCAPDNLECADVGWPVRASGRLAVGWSADAARLLLVRDQRLGPVYVAISKPDVFDVHHAWSHSLLSTGVPLANYRSFKIYKFGKRSPSQTTRRARTHQP